MIVDAAEERGGGVPALATDDVLEGLVARSGSFFVFWLTRRRQSSKRC